jgi:nucleoside-diphosphate-sugar epimerase
MIGRIAGRKPVIHVDPVQKGDMRHTYADTSLALTDLGYRPTVGLEEGLTAEHRWLTGLL